MFRLLLMSLLGMAWSSTLPGAQPKQPMRITLWAMDANGDNARELGGFPGYPIINSPEVSPDGRTVAVDGWKHGQKYPDAHVLLFDVETQQMRDLGPGCMPSWSADGVWVGISKYHPNRICLREVDAETEHEVDQSGWAIQLSPDGGKAAYVRDSDKLVVDDFASNTQLEYTPDREDPYRYIMHNCCWSPDSRRVCFLGRRRSGRREIAILTVDGGDPELHVLCDASDIDPDIDWSPDGTKITFPRRGKAGQPGQIMVVNPHEPNQSPVPLAGQPKDRSNRGMCWTPDGQTLYFVSNSE